jgi:DNA invertase Pin-like site-specific DNA recombinase
MNESAKIHAHHLTRGAYLYIRQSSMRQVLENLESSKRQYALRARAIALGWREEQITVIDSDQGESGASATWREGFQHLVSEVGLGRAGIVMGLEVSRLARNSADWHRLLEICAFADTLILDEDGVYDPSSFNDRLLLGLKGTMSEAELHVLKARLRGGILNKVRRGEYRCPLPTGLIYDERGNCVLDPDSQVRETIAYFFATFERVGSASQTVKVFRNEGLLFPSRYRNQDTVIFRPLTISAATRTLNNPRYAGAYAYGRRHYRRTVDGTKIVETRGDINEWTVCIPNAHPGYITWEQFLGNRAILKNNGRPYEIARNAPPREGAALLQGRAVCGRCGRYMTVRYAARRGNLEAWYVCHREHVSQGAPYCQSIAGSSIDEAIGALVTREMTPSAVELTLEIQNEIEQQYQETDQLHARAVERARIEADLAKRRFMLVDPSNRLVADTLEAEWNEKLRVLAVAQEEQDRVREQNRSFLNEAVRKRLITMTTDFATLWADPTTPNRERKRLLAYVIEDATLIKLPDEGVTRVHVRFRGGKTETFTSMNPKSSAEKVKTPTNIIALIDSLLEDHIYSEIAAILNQGGLRPGGTARPGHHDDRFDATRVAYLVHRYRLCSRYDRLRRRGMLTRKETAEQLGIHENTVSTWARHGLVTSHMYNGHACLYEIPKSNPPARHCSRWDRLADRRSKNQDERLLLGTKGDVV